MRVLIADDDVNNAALLQHIVSKQGYETAIARNGYEALGAHQTHAFQVIITDWMMPGLDGLELCRRIRAINVPRYTYVLVTTVKSSRDDMLEAMDAGADDFITKPIDKLELTARLRVAERITSLQATVKQLEMLLPICSYCHNIRTDEEDWMSLPEYISTKTDTAFSHGVCPSCLKSIVTPMMPKGDKPR